MTLINSVPTILFSQSASTKGFINLINAASSSIDITTAYYTPPRAIRRALIQAVKRGVRVRILTNGPHTTHRIALEAGRHLYRPLLKHGITIFEYQPTKIHAKLMMIDDKVTQIGSSNLNFRSAFHDEECNIIVENVATAKTLTSRMETDLKNSKEIRDEDWSRRPWSAKLKQLRASLGRYFF